MLDIYFWSYIIPKNKNKYFIQRISINIKHKNTMVSVLDTIEWNLLVNRRKDEILNSSNHNGFYLEESENISMKLFSLTTKLVSNKKII